ncbi:MAG: hypothetical protein A2622_13245 [Bdellovibrionales bacterium RIFCSPHIGHO2_01_FULL_40_29]|nr:MAG: hypothetical protein A2622_13245 [Bdellovibrionales bacterium RIFCSPHIGHO2_01_FULL_40_29]OFZ33346.1 MAG: hypothetical protein A3D17_13640 [Bdellovibrionales bacterium RIFCSPHIGHO2_02_FULL_40_15]
MKTKNYVRTIAGLTLATSMAVPFNSWAKDSLALKLDYSLSTPLKSKVERSHQVSDSNKLGMTRIFEAIVETDSSYAAARHEAEAVRQRLHMAEAAKGARVDATGGLYHTQSFSGNESGAGGNLMINLTYPIYRQENNINMTKAEIQVQLAELRTLLARQDLVLRTATNYFDILSVQVNAKIDEAQVSYLRKTYDLEKIRFDRGLGTKQNVTRLEAELRIAEAQSQKSKSDLDSRTYDLSQRTGLKIKSLKMVSENAPISEPSPNNREAWADQAAKDSLIVRSQDSLYELSKQDIGLARAAYSPYVYFGASAGIDRTSKNHSMFSSNSSTSRGATVGVYMTIPLYDGGSRSAATRESGAMSEKFLEDRRGAETAITSQARENFTATISSIEKSHALKSAYTVAKDNYTTTAEGYQSGTSTLTDMLQAQQMMFQTRRDYNLERMSAIVASLKLKFTSGQLSEADLALIDKILE